VFAAFVAKCIYVCRQDYKNYLSTDFSQFLQFVLCKFGFPWFIGFGILQYMWSEIYIYVVKGTLKVPCGKYWQLR
jgi:hypothetical protein